MYTEKELSKLIEDVEQAFTAHLAKSESGSEPLVKSEEKEEPFKDKKPEAEHEKHEEGKEAPKHEAKEAHENKEAPKHEEQAPEHKEEAKEGEHKEVEAKDGDEHCDYDDEDLEHMHKMYSSMSKGELKAHHDAVRKAIDSGSEHKVGEMQMSKSETVIEVNVEKSPEPNKEMELLKSEIANANAKAEGLQKNLDAVSEFLTKLAKKSAPQGKAITSLDVIAKSETLTEEKELTKSEVTTILAKKSAEPSLAKSDRDLINAYYLNSGSINSIKHLLK